MPIVLADWRRQETKKPSGSGVRSTWVRIAVEICRGEPRIARPAPEEEREKLEESIVLSPAPQGEVLGWGSSLSRLRHLHKPVASSQIFIQHHVLSAFQNHLHTSSGNRFTPPFVIDVPDLYDGLDGFTN